MLSYSGFDLHLLFPRSLVAISLFICLHKQIRQMSVRPSIYQFFPGFQKRSTWAFHQLILLELGKIKKRGYIAQVDHKIVFSTLTLTNSPCCPPFPSHFSPRIGLRPWLGTFGFLPFSQVPFKIFFRGIPLNTFASISLCPQFLFPKFCVGSFIRCYFENK